MGPCEHSSKHLSGVVPSGFIKCGEFHGQLRNFWLLKKGTALWS